MRGYLAHTLVIGEICGVFFATKPGFADESDSGADMSFKSSVTSEKPVCSTHLPMMAHKYRSFHTIFCIPAQLIRALNDWPTQKRLSPFLLTNIATSLYE